MLTCGIEGGAAPFRFEWYKDGKRVHQTTTLTIITSDIVSNIRFKTLAMTDSGNYSCSASNSYGSDSFTTEVIVEGKCLRLYETAFILT